MAYQRNRANHLEKERDVGLNVAPEGTPIPDRVCGGCAFYRKGGYCEARRKDVGPLWEACNHYTTNETPKPQDTLEKTETPTTKVCKRCGRELPLEAFGKTVRSKDGYQSNCRECQAELVRQGWEKRRAEGKAHPAPMQKKKASDEVRECVDRIMAKDEAKERQRVQRKAERIANPALAEFPDHDLVNELRRRGYDVTCKKTIEL